MMIAAADTLAARFNPRVGCIKSWNNKEFPADFQARWVRFSADAPCRATATLLYK